ncbi:hypothetical protein GPECTOR_102g39 [Gonium pectorale]|uniref:Uncharacterized protein n=1 Tax=Gonium pectorale TaxID=33097 RepID=A0A150FZP2_GONPE|nr:hypothetical protein GPECTOR_102g39 [Gonium pectorale]|eukprot:KXZ43086.1 hypothetical protein GPECTOR_102g39 [Gonium pectorale]
MTLGSRHRLHFPGQGPIPNATSLLGALPGLGLLNSGNAGTYESPGLLPAFTNLGTHSNVNNGMVGVLGQMQHAGLHAPSGGPAAPGQQQPQQATVADQHAGLHAPSGGPAAPGQWQPQQQQPQQATVADGRVQPAGLHAPSGGPAAPGQQQPQQATVADQHAGLHAPSGGPAAPGVDDQAWQDPIAAGALLH